MLDRVWVDEAIAGHCECTGPWGRSTSARAGDEALRAWVSPALDPLAQGRIRQLEGVGNGWEALPLDDGAHGLSTAKDAGLLGLLHEGIPGGQGGIGNVEFEGPHSGGLQEQLRQKFTRVHGPWILLSAQSFFDSNFPGAAYEVAHSA